MSTSPWPLSIVRRYGCCVHVAMVCVAIVRHKVATITAHGAFPSRMGTVNPVLWPSQELFQGGLGVARVLSYFFLDISTSPCIFRRGSEGFNLPKDPGFVINHKPKQNETNPTHKTLHKTLYTRVVAESKVYQETLCVISKGKHPKSKKQTHIPYRLMPHVYCV